MFRRTWIALATVLLFGVTADSAVGSPQVEAAATPSAPSPQLRVAPSSRFAWPVQPHRVLRRFQAPTTRWGPGHRGVDLGTRAKADVLAPADGVVTFSGVVAGRGVLTIQHPQGFSTTYEPVSARIASGTAVTRGQRIAILDDGHCADQTCLHWGYRVEKDNYRDPLTLIAGRRPVLLPPLP